jgi:hypothetical protein
MTEAEKQTLKLLVHALRKEASEHMSEALKQRARYKYFELHICHDCLHRYVINYIVLGFASDKHRRCELCGLEQPYLFECLFAKTTRRRGVNCGFKRGC